MTTFSKNQVNFYTVTEKDCEQRLDNLLNKLFKKIPKNHIYRIIRSGEVRVNKKRATPTYKVNIGDLIRIPPIEIEASKSQDTAKSIIFSVLYEDQYLMIINKPSGIACHGGSGVNYGVIESLRVDYPESKFLELAHRLDKNTSGVLVLAKKRQALVKFQELIRVGQTSKHYLALTIGQWDSKSKNVKLPLYKHTLKNGGQLVKVDKEKGSFAYTIFKVIKEFDNYTLVDADLKTGKTHQIRVHLQTIGHPILGDDKYGDFELNRKLSKNGLTRMFLHAKSISFIHPITHEKLIIEAPLPQELQDFIASLS